MDPDANLREQISLANDVVMANLDDPREAALALEDASRLAGLVLALHEWMRKGGHAPQAWGKR